MLPEEIKSFKNFKEFKNLARMRHYVVGSMFRI